MWVATQPCVDIIFRFAAPLLRNTLQRGRVGPAAGAGLIFAAGKSMPSLLCSMPGRGSSLPSQTNKGWVLCCCTIEPHAFSFIVPCIVVNRVGPMP